MSVSLLQQAQQAFLDFPVKQLEPGLLERLLIGKQEPSSSNERNGLCLLNAPRFCHISPLLRGLHWLPVKARIQFKILLITFKAIHGLAPKYLCDLLTFKSSLYNLRSSGSILLSMPAVRSKTLGDRAFMVAAPRLWNSLPKELRAITNVNSFKAHIKTYLFRTLYW